MDIDRLNRIREICFKGSSKSKTRKTQNNGGGGIRSPFGSRKEVTRMPENDKENFSLESS